MGYVWSDAEVAAAQQLITDRRFTSEAVTVSFETTPEFVAAVLPPCFEPADNRGTITVGTGRGASCGEYGSGLINLNVRYQGQEGQYTLTSIYGGDTPVSIGREFFAEPKKRGDGRIFRAGDDIYGYVERHGVRIIEIEGTLDLTPQEPNVQEVYRWEVLGNFDHNAQIEGDPFVFVAKKRLVNNVVLRGQAQLRLNGNGFDPVDEIPILSVGELVYTTGEMDTIEQAKEPITDGRDYTPYILGRHHDLFTAYPVPGPLQVPFPLPK